MMMNKYALILILLLSTLLAWTGKATSYIRSRQEDAEASGDEVDSRKLASCEDNHRYCESWADYGYCESNPNYMHTKCPKSCSTCDKPPDPPPPFCPDTGCLDCSTSCSNWASEGLCDTNPEYMYFYCRKSCQTCDCRDDNSKCSNWASKGECQINPDYMEQVCRKSCGTCTGPGFTIGSCDPNPCLNGGTCQEEGNYDYRCLCRDGYTGRRCENEETQRIRFKMRRDDGYGGKWLRARNSPGGRLTYDITAGERWYTWWIRKGDQLIAENTNRCLTRVPCGDNDHCQADDVDFMTCRSGDGDQEWRIVNIGGGLVMIENPGKDCCLDIFRQGGRAYGVDCVSCDSDEQDQHWLVYK